jgi:hypothetical protein
MAERGWRFRAPRAASHAWRSTPGPRPCWPRPRHAIRARKILVITHEGVIRRPDLPLAGRLYYPYEPKLLGDRRLQEIRPRPACSAWAGLNEALTP